MKTFYLLNVTTNSDIERVDAVIQHVAETFLSGVLVAFFVVMAVYSVYMMIHIAKYYLSAFFNTIKSQENDLEVRFRSYNSSMLAFLFFAYIFIKYVFLGGTEPPANLITFVISCLSLCGFILSWITHTTKAFRKHNRFIFLLLSIFACSHIIIWGIIYGDIMGTVFSICAGLTILITIVGSIILKKAN